MIFPKMRPTIYCATARPAACWSAIHRPGGVLDVSSGGRKLGSQAVRETIIRKQPELVVCGHIHGSAGQIDRIGETTVINAGPQGIIWEL